MIQFKYTILYVPDVTKAITFYEAAFGFERTFISPDNDYGELQTGPTTLSFASETLAGSNLPNGFAHADAAQKPFAIELGFVTDDVSAMIEKAIAAGARLYAAPAVKPWGQTVAYVRDLNGFLIELCTPVAH
ncbi:VOC family protein [Edaphocola aurantiacus]|uniref:VOC family protein n=1 Tax=Edaphocola aurantiacus TaxID=2601682 RepID=UPI001C968634|nr:VOC family protein [Edaphocola aurantiacus]